METPHKQRMREIAGTLAREMTLPSAMMKDLWRDLPFDFQPGQYYLPIGAVQIDAHKRLKVKYYDLTDGIAEPHLVRGLLSHLATSGLSRYSALAADSGMLNNLRDKASQYSQAMLVFLKQIADIVTAYRAKINYQDEPRPGLMKWFTLTIWLDALSQAEGQAWVTNSWYLPPEPFPPSSLWQLRCGANIIGVARSKKTLQIYENWHRILRTQYAQDPAAKDVSAKGRELGPLFQDIRQRLLEFSDLEHLPGRCALC